MCKAYEDYLSRAIDHDLTAAEEETFVAHLQMCETCRKDYEALKQLKHLCGQVAPSPLPEHFHQDLMAKVLAAPQQASLSKEAKAQKVLKKGQDKYAYRGFALAASFVFVFALMSQLGKLDLMRTPAKATEEIALNGQEDAQAKSAPINSRMSQEGSMATQERTGALKDDMDLASVAPMDTIWEVEVADVTSFKSQLITYLEEEQIAYEQYEADCFQIDKGKAELIEAWLVTQDVTKQVITGTEPNKIVIKLLPKTS